MKQVTEFNLDLASLAALTGAVEAFCTRAGLDRDLALRLSLVVEELLTNAVTHGAGARQGARGRLTLGLVGDELELVYEDQAVPFDPLQGAPDPPLEQEVLQRPVGGLGLHLIRQLSDRQSYVFAEGWNRLTLHKRV